MKATEQYFPAVLFIMLYKLVPTFESVDEILKCDQLKTTEQYFSVVVFLGALNKVVVTQGRIQEFLIGGVQTLLSMLKLFYG